MIFERNTTGSNLLSLLDTAPLFVDAEIAYVNFGKAINSTERFEKVGMKFASFGFDFVLISV